MNGCGRIGQPLAQQRVDLLGSEPIADRLQRRGVVDRGEPVVQRRSNAMPALAAWRLAHSLPLMHSLALYGKVGAELEEERAEIVVDAVEVEVVDHPGGGHDPRVGIAIGVAAASRCETAWSSPAPGR